MSIRPSAGNSPALEWTKSSYSTNDGPDCVEVAAIPGTILVRDSKNVQGPQLGFEPGAWARFLSYTAER
ncbi:DUF397 domain-containing protein [Streptomyces sp. S07_1.15]|uniref:DUF397 domain-containing protein n=1 Tax=Streptomyces sp. S07_1.15 TaxID=2873925 RepID=UPI001D15DF94|nr:DUF397 domain-containing protein [Streptomyces sp. S07_1.15]MCC3653352.1 DUF397 domain-containing protein [Streptomyces sp. S07_1.15]